MYIDNPIIFVGLGRSGTSIISEIVFEHEDLAWPSNYQNKFPNSELVNLVRPLLDNKFWQFNGQKPQLNKVPWYNGIAFRPSEAYNFWNYLAGPDINFSRNFMLGVEPDKKRKTMIAKSFSKLVKYQNKKRLAFKITGPGRIGYLSSIFPNAIFIEIAREPFANIRSLLKVPFWQKSGMYNLHWTGAYSREEILEAQQLTDYPSLLSAFQYKKIRDTIYEEVNTYEVNYHLVEYESFIKEPHKQIANILEIGGLAKSQRIERYFKNNAIYDRNTDSRSFFGEEERNKIVDILGSKYI